MSELFREAFRTYSAQQARRTLDELGEYAAGRNPKGYTEADVPRLIKEVRAEKPRRRVRSNGGSSSSTQTSGFPRFSLRNIAARRRGRSKRP
jgi:hypothetical protein